MATSPQRLRNQPAIVRMLWRTTKTDTCWLWQGATNSKGYGNMRSDNGGPVVSVHRVSYEHYIGPIPEGFEIDHLCRVRNCVFPMHLEAVPHAENVRRTDRKATACKRGHLFDEANTAVDKRGMKVCRTCGRERMRVWRARKTT